MERGGNHIAAGVAAALALPFGVFALGLPLVLAAPLALAVYAGVALALTPRRRLERIDFTRIGRAQADVVSGLIDEGDAAVTRLRGAASGLRSTEARSSVEHLADAAQAILTRLAAAPEKLPAVRRFLAYYLPRSVEIAEGLGAVERQSAPSAARQATIAATLGKLDQAFAYYADGFDQADLAALDVELKLVGSALADDDLGPIPAAATSRKE